MRGSTYRPSVRVSTLATVGLLVTVVLALMMANANVWAFDLAPSAQPIRTQNAQIAAGGTLWTGIEAGGVSYPDGCGNLPLVQAFQSEVAGGASPFHYNWSFGDGTQNSSLANPDHSYATYGEYTVLLVVTDSTGANAFANKSLYEGQATCTSGSNVTTATASMFVVLPIGIVAGVACGVVDLQRHQKKKGP